MERERRRDRRERERRISAVNQPVRNLMKDACEKKCRLNEERVKDRDEI